MEKRLELANYTIEEIQALCGANEENIAILEEEFKTDIIVRGNEIIIQEENEQLEDVIMHLLKLIRKHIRVSKKEIMSAIALSKSNQLKDLITPKTIGQRDYYLSLKNNDVVFAIGPAGTGKTYLAVIFAVQALKNNEVKRIILTRPAVEAGESLGFLPGDLKEKIDPYLRPLYDALYDMLGVEKTDRLIEKGIIEIAPLAYMRGRTLDDAYVILDEAQNTTNNQMKMFLTRLGFNSKMIITGDITQIDLAHGVESGLKVAAKLLKGVKGIKFIYLSALDVVRHPVVARIIERYDEEAKRREELRKNRI